MKKILYFLLLSLVTINMANASDKIHVTAKTEFNSAKPVSTIEVQVIDNAELGTYQIPAGSVLYCNIINIINPKRGKRSASFKVQPTAYEYEGNTVKIETTYLGKYAEKIISKEELQNIDAKKVGKKAAVTVGNHFVKGVAPVASLAEGMIKNNEGNRIQSGVKQVYEDSFVSYVEKGKDLNLEPGDNFYLIFSD